MEFDSGKALASQAPVTLGVTNWVPITPDDVAHFARVTRAEEWIHLDEDRAQRESPFGTTVVHGYLTLSLATAFLTELLQVRGLGLGVNYGLDRVRFPAAAPVGSRVRASGTLLSARPHGDGVRTVAELTFESDASSKPVCIAEVVSLLLPTP